MKIYRKIVVNQPSINNENDIQNYLNSFIMKIDDIEAIKKDFYSSLDMYRRGN